MAWSALFALAVAVLQAGAFGDIFAAGRFLAANDAIGPDAVCYSNETFAGGMDGAKLAFASGREVRLPPELMAAADSSALARAFGIDKPPAAPGFMEPGSVLALHTAYGGPAGVLGLLNAMARRYTLKPLDRNAAEALARIGAPTGETEDISEGFESWLVPLLPDIMEEPITHQNPLAWLLRYRRQDFATWLFVIREIKAGESPGG